MSTAIEVLRFEQRQCDAEGIVVQVSRQALDEVLDEIERLKAKCSDREILRAFFEAFCDDDWKVVEGIRAALLPTEALKELT